MERGGFNGIFALLLVTLAMKSTLSLDETVDWQQTRWI
jgi:hypothetical protein